MWFCAREMRREPGFQSGQCTTEDKPVRVDTANSLLCWRQELDQRRAGDRSVRAERNTPIASTDALAQKFYAGITRIASDRMWSINCVLGERRLGCV
jgi:hypothetical protein